MPDRRGFLLPRDWTRSALIEAGFDVVANVRDDRVDRLAATIGEAVNFEREARSPLDVERLVRLAKDWRYSDEFIGIVVRNQVPRDYSDLSNQPSTEPHHEVASTDDG